MLDNDIIFQDIIHRQFGCFPFKPLPVVLPREAAETEESLRSAFLEVFTHEEACVARNVVFFWAVTEPFVHLNGSQRPSTISYVEITTRSLKNRWPACYGWPTIRSKTFCSKSNIPWPARIASNFCTGRRGYTPPMKDHMKSGRLTPLASSSSSAIRSRKGKNFPVRTGTKHPCVRMPITSLLLNSEIEAHGTLSVQRRPVTVSGDVGAAAGAR